MVEGPWESQGGMRLEGVTYLTPYLQCVTAAGCNQCMLSPRP